MPRRIRRRPLYLDLHLPGMSRRAKLLVILTVVLSIIAAVTIRSIAYFRELSCQMVLSDATDLMTLCINDTIMHIANPHLPFGGVGNRGMGAYHHRRTFEAFTHRKAVLVSNKRVELPVKYPPYKWVKWIKGLLK